MPRRSARDDAALAEAYRRLDGAATSAGSRSEGVVSAGPTTISAQSVVEAEAKQVDAALHGLFQPVAAPDTLAGRVAGEVGRANVARWRRGAWLSPRPAWTMGLVGAVVVALFAGAMLAATGRGGTMGQRVLRTRQTEGVLDVGGDIAEQSTHTLTLVNDTEFDAQFEVFVFGDYTATLTTIGPLDSGNSISVTVPADIDSSYVFYLTAVVGAKTAYLDSSVTEDRLAEVDYKYHFLQDNMQLGAVAPEDWPTPQWTSTPWDLSAVPTSSDEPTAIR